MKVLFIGGTGIISSGRAQVVIERGIELFVLSRGQSHNFGVPTGATALRGDIRHDPDAWPTYRRSAPPAVSLSGACAAPTGTVPWREIVMVLAGAGQKGHGSFEREKKWHPEIEDPEIAIPQYAKVMREYLPGVGVQTK